MTNLEAKRIAGTWADGEESGPALLYENGAIKHSVLSEIEVCLQRADLQDAESYLLRALRKYVKDRLRFGNTGPLAGWRDLRS